MADTYGDLSTQILDECRSTETTVIQTCIKEAVAFYEPQTFWFNDDRTQTFATVASQEYYTTAANAFIPFITEFEELTLAVSTTNKVNLDKQSWDTLQGWNPDALSTGQPTDYAYAFRQIRLYPIPTAVYTVTMAIAYKLAELSAAGDTNCWTTRGQGEALIRNHAKWLYYTQYRRDDVNAARAQAAEMRWLENLQASTSRRQATGTIRGCL